MTTQTPSKEGTIPFTPPLLDKQCSTYYKVYGTLSSTSTPLIILHGGPGAGHDYLLTFAELWPRHTIPVVFYDQTGCGESTHLPEEVSNHAFWQMSLWEAELQNLLDHLGIKQYHLLGQSFGGMLAASFATKQPHGLQRLILASGIPSRAHSMASFAELKSLLAPEQQSAIDTAISTGDFTSEGYRAVFGYMVRHYLVRTANPPPEMLASHAKMGADSTMLLATSGPSPWLQNGSLLAWSCVDDLHRIRAPTLIYNAEFDTSSRDVAQKPFFENISKVRWVRFEDAGHMCHLETPELREKVLTLVGGFLTPPTFETE